jgi:hypothetical protein
MRIAAIASAGLALAFTAAGCGGHATTPPVPTGYAMPPSLKGFGLHPEVRRANFSLGSLGTTDVRSDNLADCFDFTQTPRGFNPIPAPGAMSQFLSERPAPGYPDDDN